MLKGDMVAYNVTEGTGAGRRRQAGQDGAAGER